MNKQVLLLNAENAVITIIGRAAVSAYHAKHQIILENIINACHAQLPKMQINALIVHIITLVILLVNTVKLLLTNNSAINAKASAFSITMLRVNVITVKLLQNLDVFRVTALDMLTIMEAADTRAIL